MFGKSFHEKLVDINKVKYVTVASRNWGGYGSKDPNQTVNRDYSNLGVKGQSLQRISFQITKLQGIPLKHPHSPVGVVLRVQVHHKSI